ncbi:MAG: DUF2283 domain-containing protein [Chloroherpetonaceae bacterium]|nr:DUF2283 domain-containing protein [Chloroherpetonaceae bacterium]
MTIRYDRKTDILRIEPRDAPIEESDEAQKGVILDYDQRWQWSGQSARKRRGIAN